MSVLDTDSGMDSSDRRLRNERTLNFSTIHKRKEISHFDCTSVVTDLSDALFVGASRESLSTRNVKTGASSAGCSELTVETPDNGKANLVLPVPNFWTEVGWDRPAEKEDLSFATTPCDGLLMESVVFDEAEEISDVKRYNFSELKLVRPETKYQRSTVPSRFEYMDHGARYYRLFFAEHEHQNFFGVDDQMGPVAVSLRREACSAGHASNADLEMSSVSFMYRVIVRTPQIEVLRCCVLEDSIQVDGVRPKPGCMPAKEVLQYVAPKLPVGCLRLAQTGLKVVEKLQQLDEQTLSKTFKFGVLFCRAGQSTEEQMYNNEDGSESFVKFLSCIASRVTLRHFEGYRAQLDNRNDSTGTHSYYTVFHGNEIMLHVSTLLPFTKEGRQQLQRKRHIGNDIVTVVFQEEDSPPFTPASVRSHFQHIFIVVREVSSVKGTPSYMVAVSAADSVPRFGPPLPSDPVFAHGEEFREFLLTKLINAEGAGHRSTKFLTLTRRTRFECLQHLHEDWTVPQTLEAASTTTVFYGRWSQALKKRKTSNARLVTASQATRALPGGVTWPVEVVSWGVDNTGKPTSCTLCVSPTYLCLVSVEKQQVLFCVQTKSIISWSVVATQTTTIYYNEGEFVKFHCLCIGNSLVEVDQVIARLSAVTNGCFAQEAVLRRNPDGHLGFILHQHGMVGEVDPYGVAWKSGLRQGARLLEINGTPVYGQPPQAVLEQIRSTERLLIIIAPPTASGTVRGEQLRGKWQQADVLATQMPVTNTWSGFALSNGKELPSSAKERVRTFDRSQLTLQKRRKDRHWGDIVSERKPQAQSSPKRQDANLKGVVEKAKRALAASGLSSNASSTSGGPSTHYQKSQSAVELLSVHPRRPMTPVSPFDKDWCGPVAVSSYKSQESVPQEMAVQPAAVPYATCGYARPLQAANVLPETPTSNGASPMELSSRLHSAEREVARLQEELSKVHEENRSLVHIVNKLDPHKALNKNLTTPVASR